MALEHELHGCPDGVEGASPRDLSAPLAALPQASARTSTSRGLGLRGGRPGSRSLAWLRTQQGQGRVWRVSVAGGWWVNVPAKTDVGVRAGPGNTQPCPVVGCGLPLLPKAWIPVFLTCHTGYKITFATCDV